MEKLPMCRICLVQNVRMFLVASRNLRDLYEKLTDIPFVTEDSRPILACFICCTKLKQCYRLLRQCLEAEELFAQKINDNYEPNPLINPGHFGFYSGFIRSPTENINIVTVDVVQTGSIAVKQELPAVCEGLDIIELKEKHQSGELELDNLNDSCPDVPDIPPHHSESDLEDDVPLMEFKTEVEEEQEVSKKKQRARETTKLELENLDNSLDVADISPHHSESDLENDVPLIEFNTEVEEELEVSKKKRRARQTTRANVAKKPKLDTRRTQEKDAITAEQISEDKFDSKVIRTTQIRTSEPDIYFKESYKCDQRNFSEKPYKCDVCQRNFSAKGPLTAHICRHTGEKPYKCGVCQRSFSKMSHLSLHTRIHTGEKPYKCDVCQCSFSRKCHLSDHTRIHTGEKPYKCDVCQRSFSRKCHLSDHTRIHTGEKPYKCDVCQLSFSMKGQLSQHMRKHNEKPYKCDLCQRSFSEKGNLLQHIRIHTGEKPYKCDVCQRSFSRKSSLSDHTRIHTGEKPYKCDVCQLSYNMKSRLSKHIRTHTRENLYKCDVCQRSYSDRRSLTRHILIHTGGKPYKCDLCQRSFIYRGCLARHILLHTGGKPYKCDLCQRSFNHKGNLTKHIRTHSGEKPYKCDVCQRGFSQKAHLSIHIRRKCMTKFMNVNEAKVVQFSIAAGGV